MHARSSEEANRLNLVAFHRLIRENTSRVPHLTPCIALHRVSYPIRCIERTLKLTALYPFAFIFSTVLHVHQLTTLLCIKHPLRVTVQPEREFSAKISYCLHLLRS